MVRRGPGGAWTEDTRSTIYFPEDVMDTYVGQWHQTNRRPAVLGNKGERSRWIMVGLLLCCFIVWIVSCCKLNLFRPPLTPVTAVGPQMHSSCMLHIRSEPYVSGPDGVDLCFGLHGYYDRSTNATISQHGYNIMEVVRNATDYPDLSMKLGPVTRGFGMTYFWTGECTSSSALTPVILFFYIGALAADVFPSLPDQQPLSGIGTTVHFVLMFVNIIPVAINLSVFVGVRNTLIQQGKEHAGAFKVSPVGALAWLQLLSLFVFWGALAAALLMDFREDIFEQRSHELRPPPANRRFGPTADAHAFPYYFHTQAGMDVTTPVTPPSSIYVPGGMEVHPRQAFGEDWHRHQS